MKTLHKITLLSTGILILCSLISFGNPTDYTKIETSYNLTKAVQQKAIPDNTIQDTTVYKVTFIELGSIRCIPCQKMQLVMKAIEKKFGSQVKVIFHDVWTEEGKPFGKQYNINAIPTQILLDEKGKEFFRHVGYFPEEALIKELKKKGVQ